MAFNIEHPNRSSEHPDYKAVDVDAVIDRLAKKILDGETLYFNGTLIDYSFEDAFENQDYELTEKLNLELINATDITEIERIAKALIDHHKKSVNYLAEKIYRQHMEPFGYTDYDSID